MWWEATFIRVWGAWVGSRLRAPIIRTDAQPTTFREHQNLNTQLLGSRNNNSILTNPRLSTLIR